MFDDHILRDQTTGLHLDRTDAPAIPFDALEAQMAAALAAMEAIEGGAIANEDEQRMVGHYWLRAPALAPTPALRAAIEAMHAQVAALDPRGLRDVVVVGIGGSALGTQLLADALSNPGDAVRLHFLDNTDPEGLHRVLGALDLEKTAVVVISKSGGTPETHNGMLAAQAAYAKSGVPFAPRALAITGPGSGLDQLAEKAGWRDRFPLWDWVGGRVSVTSPVGLVPMALAGYDWRGFLAGAADADALTRLSFRQNPAALLAATWFVAGHGKGDRALVIEPYRDRFLLLSRHLQQLVMESLGKAQDRQGREVHQGIAVYGNKGSTDQHALMQQVRDGRDDTLTHFIETRAQGPATPVDHGRDASDHLVGLLYGTRTALKEAGRPSLTLGVPDASARSLGLLIALFERAVGLYGELININAYNQPGVEAGKRAAKGALSLLERLEGALGPSPQTAGALAEQLDSEPILTWRLLTHLAATGRASAMTGERPSGDRFSRG